MKVTNWRRRLSAALLAGGLMIPAVVDAAGFNINLVSNPGFESVDPSVTCCFGATKLNGWSNGTQTGFAYNYSLNYDGGGPLAGGGTYYFTSNAEGTVGDVDMPGEVAQDIDLSSGLTAVAIASGGARYELSAFFTGYAPDTDFGSLQLDFLNSGRTSLGTALITDVPGANKVWRQLSTSGIVPVGTTTARISPFGTVISGFGGPDGYIDNVDFRITGIVPEPTTCLLVSIGLAGVMPLRCRNRS